MCEALTKPDPNDKALEFMDTKSLKQLEPDNSHFVPKSSEILR